MSISDPSASKKFNLLYVSFCKFYTNCLVIQRVCNSLFLIRRSQCSLIVSIPLVLNPVYLDLKPITIEYRGIQNAINVLQKYRLYEDYTDLF